MAASYSTELEALNAIYDLLEAKLDTIDSHVDGLEGLMGTNNSTLAEIQGETPDIRAKVTDVKIERIYIGDRDDRRQKSEAMIADLLNQGYRPYVFLGQNEDLARYAFAKYTGPNAPVI